MEVRLPQFGMGMQEGTINAWFKHEGDTVAAGEAMAEVEAAKTTEDLVAPGSGVLQRVLVPEGDTVPVNELLAVIVPIGVVEPDVAEDEQDAVEETGAVADRRAWMPASAEDEQDAVEETGAVADRRAWMPASAGDEPRRQITPRARKLAADLAIGIDSVVGTGPGGRVTEDDVAATARGSTPSRPGSPAASVSTASATSVPLTRMRATIASRMHASLQSTAQLTLVTTADVTDLVAQRDVLDDPRPTYTDLVVRAVALALREHPRLNAVLDGNEIRLLADIHLGVATALDDGLVVPVVRNADRKSLEDIARESAELIRRVRSGTFSSDDVSGSTFTVTSLGGQGIDAFTPILNPPEVAILGVGRVVDRPVRQDQGLTWRKAMTLSLTIDHRVVDGAPGADFLQTLSKLLASPPSLH